MTNPPQILVELISLLGAQDRPSTSAHQGVVGSASATKASRPGQVAGQSEDLGRICSENLANRVQVHWRWAPNQAALNLRQVRWGDSNPCRDLPKRQSPQLSQVAQLLSERV